MTYALVGWAVALSGLAGFALWTITRGRRLSRTVPPERRRWTS